MYAHAVLEGRNLNWVSEAKVEVRRVGCILSGGTWGELLTFPASRGCPRVLVHGPLLYLKASPASSSLSLTPTLTSFLTALPSFKLSADFRLDIRMKQRPWPPVFWGVGHHWMDELALFTSTWSHRHVFGVGWVALTAVGGACFKVSMNLYTMKSTVRHVHSLCAWAHGCSEALCWWELGHWYGRLFEGLSSLSCFFCTNLPFPLGKLPLWTYLIMTSHQGLHNHSHMLQTSQSELSSGPNMVIGSRMVVESAKLVTACSEVFPADSRRETVFL